MSHLWHDIQFAQRLTDDLFKIIGNAKHDLLTPVIGDQNDIDDNDYYDDSICVGRMMIRSGRCSRNDVRTSKMEFSQ